MKAPPKVAAVADAVYVRLPLSPEAALAAQRLANLANNVQSVLGALPDAIRVFADLGIAFSELNASAKAAAQAVKGAARKLPRRRARSRR